MWRNGRWFTEDEKKKLGRKREGEKAEEERGRVGRRWLEASKGPGRRPGAWLIGVACGKVNQMVSQVLPEQPCLHSSPVCTPALLVSHFCLLPISACIPAPYQPHSCLHPRASDSQPCLHPISACTPAQPGWGASAPSCQKVKGMHSHCLMKIKTLKLSNSQDWFKLLQLTNDLIHKNGDGYQIDLFKWTHAEEIPFGSCTWNFLFPNAN